MLSALSYDPALQTKRLGDGFYEQKLVREQINQLTGRLKGLQRKPLGTLHWQITDWPAPLNGASGLFQTWLLPIGDNGYTFIFGLGANQDSLKYPQAHAQMQAIFKHLIKSVKIEPSRGCSHKPAEFVRYLKTTDFLHITMLQMDGRSRDASKTN